MAVPFRIRRAEWVAGTLVVVTALVVVIGLLLVARARGTFIEHREYWVTMEQGYGLAPGATVEMLGIEVGKIDKVEIDERNAVQVHFAIDDEYARRIRSDSVVRVKMSLGLQTMLGGVGLTVSPGSNEAGPAPDDGHLQVVEPSKVTDLLPGVGGDEMIADVEAILANTRTLTDDLASPDSELRQLIVNVALLVDALNKGEGTLGKLLRDDAALYTKLTTTLEEVGSTLDETQRLMGKGGKLLDKSDAALTASSDLIEKTDGVVTVAGNTVKRVDPVLEDTGKAMENLGDAVASFGQATRELSDVLDKMDRVIDQLDEITRATKKVFPIRRHLDDKNKGSLVDGPAR